jgi:hypothetical protein
VVAVKVSKISIAIVLTVAVSLALVLLIPPSVVPATACEVENEEICLSVPDLSLQHKSMIEEASDLAGELFGNHPEKNDEFTSQLMATYLAAKDKDIVVIFNSGGWGWTAVENTREGESFINGIESELADMGYSLLFLNHKRTARTLDSGIGEFMLAADLYPSKAEDLAARVEFLSNHIPDIKVILVGVSNGTLICDGVMNILEDNPQVYSIQIGPPFWSGVTSSGRSLVMRSNGVIPDSFSQGDLLTILRANVESLFGVYQENPGDILLYVGAPGHDYNWQYPEVSSQVTNFLQRNFGRN